MSNHKTLWIGSSVLVVTAAVLVLVQLQLIPGRDFLGQLAGVGGMTSSASESSNTAVGGGTSSSSNETTGACCKNGGCATLTPTACSGFGGTWNGAPSCGQDTCPGSSSSSPQTCQDWDKGTAVSCGGPCTDPQKECKASKDGKSCGCEFKGVSCWYCGDGGLCFNQWFDGVSSCTDLGMPSTSEGCLSKCASSNCKDLDTGTSVQCGGSCPGKMKCTSEGDLGTCTCLPEIVTSSSSSVEAYGCGWKPDVSGSPTCPADGECPEGATCTAGGSKTNILCGCQYSSDSSSSAE